MSENSFSILEFKSIYCKKYDIFGMDLEGNLVVSKKVFNEIQSYLNSIEKTLKSDSINNLKLGQRLPNIKEKTDYFHQ